MKTEQDKKQYQKKYQEKYRLFHKEKRKAYDKIRYFNLSQDDRKKQYRKHREKRLEEKRKYYIEHKDEIKKKQKEYRMNHPEIHIAKSKRRRLTKLSQMPLDANKNLIIQFYKMSERISKCCGIKFHVDHIIPISKGGLHHESNLRVIPQMINLRKGNRLVNILQDKNFNEVNI